MAPDELVLACRLSGLSLDELWLRYLEVGGSRSKAGLASRIDGADWPVVEDCYLAVVADEALQECGLPRLTSPVPASGQASGVPGDGEGTGGRGGAAAVVLEARARGLRLAELFERCARARADARGTQEHARSVRRARHAGGPPSSGGS